uniref:Uncharacterized protein n=1 Tax=Eutreptiella gymnastica TaxID=73025 RepID=A0A7S4G9Z9_9EUGL
MHFADMQLHCPTGVDCLLEGRAQLRQSSCHPALQQAQNGVKKPTWLCMAVNGEQPGLRARHIPLLWDLPGSMHLPPFNREYLKGNCCHWHFCRVAHRKKIETQGGPHASIDVCTQTFQHQGRGTMAQRLSISDE